MDHASGRLKALFHEAAGLPPPRRREFLDRSCGDDSALRDELETLLAASQEMGDYLAQPTIGAGAASDPAGGPITGSRIGRYVLLDLIGEGGFGVVYRAEQREPVKRTVALKIIKLGMDTRQVVARFEQERQALALMDHPNIAKVLDAGATETGRPYFVMELVDGDPVTRYCDTDKLDVNERLQVFARVCQAVQHAHQKGIIHRDLKPSNILVTIADGKPVPKIIDFGIAKATGPRLTEMTLVTEHRALIGTPEYMSPEQAEMGGVDIDTRTDIYSLGVLLYELLTGMTPFESNELRSAPWDELQRMIREIEPPRPSTRLSAMTQTLSDIAEKRDTQLARLRGLIRGDLDWIVMKAIEKDRARRYATADELAADIRRHLTGLPVIAAPPSTLYRIGKFIRRRRVPVIAGMTTAVVLVGATVVSTSMLMRARDAETRATDELWNSLLAQTRARRRAPEIGRRFESLETIRRMVAIRPTLEVRNEAIAALALTDMRLAASTPRFSGAPVVGVSPVGDWMLVGVSANRTEIHRTSDYTTLGVLPCGLVGQDWVHAPSISYDGRRAALRSRDDNGRTVVKVWSLPEAECVLDTPAEGDIAISPDGRELAVVRWHPSGPEPDPDHPHTLQLFDLQAKSMRWEVPVLPRALAAFRPGHAQLGVWSQTSKDGLELRSTLTGALEGLVPLPADSASVCCWSPDGDRLAVNYMGDSCFAVSAPGPSPPWTVLRGHQAFVPELYFDPGGRFLMSGSWDSTSRFWDLLTGECVFAAPTTFLWPERSENILLRIENVEPGVTQFHCYEIGRPSSFRRVAPPDLPHTTLEHLCVAVHPTSRLIVTGAFAASDLVWWTPSLDRVVGACELSGVREVAFSPKGEFLYSLGERGLERRAIALADGVLSVGPPVVLDAAARHCFAVSASGTFAVVIPQWPSARVYTIDLRNGERALSTDLPMGVSTVRLSPDDRYAAFGTWHQDTFAVWDFHDGTVKPFDLKAPASVEFSPDGRCLTASLWGGDRAYEIGSWRLLARFDSPDSLDHPTWTRYSPDGKLYARIVNNQRIRLFDASTFAEVATLESPEPYAIRALLFAPGGRELIAASNHSNVFYVWDLVKLRAELRELGLDWSDEPIPPAEISRDGPTIRAVVQAP